MGPLVIYYEHDYELHMSQRFTRNDENGGSGYAGVARGGGHGAREGGRETAMVAWFRRAEIARAGGPRAPPVGLASLRPTGCTLGF